jgi:hypothetical protein
MGEADEIYTIFAMNSGFPALNILFPTEIGSLD